MTLTYRGINHQPLANANRDRVYWYGDMEFLNHFWDLLALRSIEVSVKIHPRIETSHSQNNSLGRKQLSQVCYDSISGQVNLIDQSGYRGGSRFQRIP